MEVEDTEALMRVVPLIHYVTDQIAITNIVTANNAEALQREGFTPACILCLDSKSQSRFADDERTHVPLVDGENPPELFARAVSTLERMLLAHPRILVHCHAGRSRSIAVVAAYLVKTQGLPADAALALVASKRPCASVMPGLLLNIRQISPAPPTPGGPRVLRA